MYRARQLPGLGKFWNIFGSGLRFFLRASSPHCISCECYPHCVFYFFMLRVFLVRLLPRHMWLSHCVSCRYNTYSIQVVDFFVLIFLVLIFSLLIFPGLIFPLLIFYSADFLFMILFAYFSHCTAHAYGKVGSGLNFFPVRFEPFHIRLQTIFKSCRWFIINKFIREFNRC